jgi:hypothetical protein
MPIDVTLGDAVILTGTTTIDISDRGSMDTLYVVAKPSFVKADLLWLTAIRAKRAGNFGPPQFTLVFPGANMEQTAFATLVRSRTANTRRIRFRLRSAVVVPEPIFGHFHVFLVPDEGFGAIVRLHDRLHVGPLEVCLRPEMPYLPHVTVATESNYAVGRKLAAEINSCDLSIVGVIDKLQIERRNGDVARLHSEVPLARAGWF